MSVLRHNGAKRPVMPILVGIAGGTGAGVTTFARRLAKVLATGNTVCPLDLDSYYKDLSNLEPGARAGVNLEHPDSLDLERFCEDLYRLKQGKGIFKPAYDAETRTRYPGGSVLVSGEVVIAEGSMLFVEESVRSIFDIRVYIETPAQIRVRRRLERDVRERGRTSAAAIKQYMDSVRPMHDLFIEPTKLYAHVVIPGCEDNESAMTDLVIMIRRNLRREESPRRFPVSS